MTTDSGSIVLELHPLYDHTIGGPDQMVVTCSYIVRLDKEARSHQEVISEISLALRRVCEKWRLLAGRFEWDEKRTAWNVRVPTGVLPDSYPTHTFTHSVVKPKSPPFTSKQPWSAATAAVFECPPTTLFRDPSTPRTTQAYADKKRPILSLHISSSPSSEEEHIYVGITFVHSILDATGMGKVVEYLDCELNGKEWTPPPLTTTNQLALAYDQLAQSLPDIRNDLPLEKNRDLEQPTLWGSIKFAISILYEMFWEKANSKTIFIGSKVAAKVTEKAKKEVQEASEGKNWVSEGDVMLAWLLKAAFQHVRPSRISTSLNTMTVFTLRSTLSAHTSTPLTSYAHNANQGLLLPSIPISSLLVTPISQVALLHRQTLDLARQPTSILRQYHQDKKAGFRLLSRGVSISQWVITNQVVANLTSIRFGKGTDLVEYWCSAPPFVIDHTFAMNKFKGGWVFTGCLRKTEWESIEQVVAELGHESREV